MGFVRSRPLEESLLERRLSERFAAAIFNNFEEKKASRASLPGRMRYEIGKAYESAWPSEWAKASLLSFSLSRNFFKNKDYRRTLFSQFAILK